MPKNPPQFDPDAPASPGAGIFGLELAPEECQVRILGVPFDATSSYRQGSAGGPSAILRASHQVDLFDVLQADWAGGDGQPWKAGIHMEVDRDIEEWNMEARRLASFTHELGIRKEDQGNRIRVDELGEMVNQRTRGWTLETLGSGALPVVVGGDHAAPFGAITAAAHSHRSLGILHIDAHADLRPAYQGFTWSHASIFHNVLEAAPSVERLVSVGLRDLGEGEFKTIERSGGRIRAVYDHQRARTANLELAIAEVGHLPDQVWLSIDIDGLDPALCPNTGTPVPGGLGWNETMDWLGALASSGKRVVGLDLCEVNPGKTSPESEDSWDAIVGARLLYKMIGAALASRA